VCLTRHPVQCPWVERSRPTTSHLSALSRTRMACSDACGHSSASTFPTRIQVCMYTQFQALLHIFSKNMAARGIVVDLASSSLPLCQLAESGSDLLCLSYIESCLAGRNEVIGSTWDLDHDSHHGSTCALIDPDLV
jgi:hypothetical protein